MQVMETSFRGRKARPGSMCWDDTGGMRYFVDYCPECRGKIAMNITDARLFAQRFQAQRRKLRHRVAIRLLRHLANE